MYRVPTLGQYPVQHQLQTVVHYFLNNRILPKSTTQNRVNIQPNKLGQYLSYPDAL